MQLTLPMPIHHPPPWRQPRDKWMVSLGNSCTNATSKRWHLCEIDLRCVLNSTPGWPCQCPSNTHLMCSMGHVVKCAWLLGEAYRTWVLTCILSRLGPIVLQFEPCLDASGFRSDVIGRIHILFSFSEHLFCAHRAETQIQGYLVHKKRPTPLGPS